MDTVWLLVVVVFFFKQEAALRRKGCDLSSGVCFSDFLFPVKNSNKKKSLTKFGRYYQLLSFKSFQVSKEIPSSLLI